MLALPDPASNVAFDVVFTSKKECDYFCCFMTVLPNTIIDWLAVCFDCFHVFSHVIFHIHQHRGVLRVTMFLFFERSPAAAGWMALEWLKVYWEPKGLCVVGAHPANQLKVGEMNSRSKGVTSVKQWGQDYSQFIRGYHAYIMDRMMIHMRLCRGQQLMPTVYTSHQHPGCDFHLV